MRACIGCSAPCCREMVITATAFDIVRIEERWGEKAEVFSHLRRLDLLAYNPKEVVVAHEKGQKNHYVLALKSHPCYFYRNGECAIYSYAPLACRLYPYSSEGKLVGSLCPLKNKLLHFLKPPSQKLVEAFRREQRLYWEIVEEVNGMEMERGEAFRWLLSRAREVLKGSGEL